MRKCVDVSGAGDGSVRLWEWGVGQPLSTPRAAGTYAKCTQVRFAGNGAQLAVTDGDGALCLWHTSAHSTAELRRPFFVRVHVHARAQTHTYAQNYVCHSKGAVDVAFMGECCSLLATAGYGSADHNVALWDTLLPPHRSLVHSELVSAQTQTKCRLVMSS
jgi:WD40 repeat protein